MSLAKTSEGNSNAVSRRQFLVLAWAVASLTLIVQAAVALYQFLKPTAQAGAFGSKLSAGNVREFQVGKVSTIRAVRGYVSRLGPEGALVMSWRCTHLGCTVPWIESEGKFHCPCHGSIFNTKGEVLAGPAPRPLDLYSAEVVDNKLIVGTSRVITRTQFEASQVVPFPPEA
jgi:cytochrome b6-f complex iron-sulfur subunit